MGGSVFQKAAEILKDLPEMSEKNFGKIEKKCTKAINTIGTILPRDDNHLEILATLYSNRGEARDIKGDREKKAKNKDDAKAGARADFAKANEYRAQKKQTAAITIPALAREDSGLGSETPPSNSSSPRQENIFPQFKANNAGSGKSFVAKEEARQQQRVEVVQRREITEETIDLTIQRTREQKIALAGSVDLNNNQIRELAGNDKELLREMARAKGAKADKEAKEAAASRDKHAANEARHGAKARAYHAAGMKALEEHIDGLNKAIRAIGE